MLTAMVTPFHAGRLTRPRRNGAAGVAPGRRPAPRRSGHQRHDGGVRHQDRRGGHRRAARGAGRGRGPGHDHRGRRHQRHRALGRGGASGRERRRARRHGGHAVLQPSSAGGARPPLPRDRRRHRPADAHLRHPQAHRHGHRARDDDPHRRASAHRRQQGRQGRSGLRAVGHGIDGPGLVLGRRHPQPPAARPRRRRHDLGGRSPGRRPAQGDGRGALGRAPRRGRGDQRRLSCPCTPAASARRASSSPRPR